MNKNFFRQLVLLLILAIGVASCSSSNTDEWTKPNDKWTQYQTKLVADVISDGSYTKLEGLSGNGAVYYKPTDSLVVYSYDTRDAKDELTVTPRINKQGYPYHNDTVVCRLTSWFVDLAGRRRVYDTTEGFNNQYTTKTFVVNDLTQSTDGLATMLQEMQEGDQVEVCIPQEMGYRGNAATRPVPLPNTPPIAIRPYTTLWTRIKLVEIKPVNKKEWKKWEAES